MLLLGFAVVLVVVYALTLALCAAAAREYRRKVETPVDPAAKCRCSFVAAKCRCSFVDCSQPIESWSPDSDLCARCANSPMCAGPLR